MRTQEELERDNEELREELAVLYWKVKDIYVKLERFMDADTQHRIGIAVESAREKYKAVKVEGEPIENLEMTVRTTNALRYADILTVEQLLMCSVADLLKIPNLGRKSINELREVLASRGMTLMERL